MLSSGAELRAAKASPRKFKSRGRENGGAVLTTPPKPGAKQSGCSVTDGSDSAVVMVTIGPSHQAKCVEYVSS